MSIQKRLSLFLVVLLSFVACQRDADFINTYPEKTVLVYMVANNSLSGNTKANIDSMMAGMTRNAINETLLIYLDGPSGVPQLFKVAMNNGKITKTVFKTYPDQNSVSPTVMRTVFTDMRTYFPAQSYGLVLWSHGYGWVPGAGNLKSAPVTRWFGQDGANYMNVPDLAMALSNGPHFSYILFDACFMSGVEIAYSLRNYTDYLIASPTEVLADGFPYGNLMPYLFGLSESDYIKTASLYYDYYNALQGYDQSASIACIKCSEMENLAVEFNKLISGHLAQLNTFNAARVQNLEVYTIHLFYDFGNFAETFTTAEERSSFSIQMNKTVVYKACTPNIVSVRPSGYYEFFPVNHFSGFNTFIPQAGTGANNSAYRTTEWYTASGWNKTIW